jgi:hypothetical protein
MMETEIAPETSVIFDQLTQVMDREEFINFIHSESFRACSVFIYVYSLMAYVHVSSCLPQIFCCAYNIGM